jgi:translation initiation factor IF-2
MDLKVPKNVNATGIVIESNIDKQRGNLVSVLVKNGTLKVGDAIVIDDTFVKVKAMKDDLGNQIK